MEFILVTFFLLNTILPFALWIAFKKYNSILIGIKVENSKIEFSCLVQKNIFSKPQLEITLLDKSNIKFKPPFIGEDYRIIVLTKNKRFRIYQDFFEEKLKDIVAALK